MLYPWRSSWYWRYGCSETNRSIWTSILRIPSFYPRNRQRILIEGGWILHCTNCATKSLQIKIKVHFKISVLQQILLPSICKQLSKRMLNVETFKSFLNVIQPLINLKYLIPGNNCFEELHLTKNVSFQTDPAIILTNLKSQDKLLGLF